MNERVEKIINKMIATGAQMEILNERGVVKVEGDRMWQEQAKKDAIWSLEVIAANSVNKHERTLAKEWRIQIESELGN